MTYSYALYWLTVNLPIPCDFLQPAPADATPDVTVVYGKVPTTLLNPVASDETWELGYSWQAEPGRYLLQGGRRSGRFLVEGGTRVTLERSSTADEDELPVAFLASGNRRLAPPKGVPLAACLCGKYSGRGGNSLRQIQGREIHYTGCPASEWKHHDIRRSYHSSH